MPVMMVHEEMHQRTGEERQPDQKSEHVCAVLGKQQRGSEDREAAVHQADARVSRQALGDAILLLSLILLGHGPFLSEEG
jgi:hypothetical protein